jgi:hypothetical protein
MYSSAKVCARRVLLQADTRLPFPHGAQVSVRCRELGVYKLLGESALECQNGVWSHRVPNCIPTTLLTNFTGEFYFSFDLQIIVNYNVHIPKAVSKMSLV